MQNHVTNLELSKQLEELGVPQKSEFYWCEYTFFNEDGELQTDWVLKNKEQKKHEVGLCVSALLASELMEMLPNVTLWKDGSTYRTHDCINDAEASTPQDALALMLIYLIQSKLIEI